MSIIFSYLIEIANISPFYSVLIQSGHAIHDNITMFHDQYHTITIPTSFNLLVWCHYLELLPNNYDNSGYSLINSIKTILPQNTKFSSGIILTDYIFSQIKTFD